MTFGDAIRSCFSKYATFSGRAPRSEYWYFALLNIAVNIVLSGLLSASAGNDGAGLFAILLIVYSLAVVLPAISVSVRRLHDTDKSGWWFWIAVVPVVGSLILLILFVQKGTQGPNRFGPAPVGTTAITA